MLWPYNDFHLFVFLSLLRLQFAIPIIARYLSPESNLLRTNISVKELGLNIACRVLIPAKTGKIFCISLHLLNGQNIHIRVVSTY